MHSFQEITDAKATLMNGHDYKILNITISISYLFVVKKKTSQKAMLLSHVVPPLLFDKIKKQEHQLIPVLVFF